MFHRFIDITTGYLMAWPSTFSCFCPSDFRKSFLMVILQYLWVCRSSKADFSLLSWLYLILQHHRKCNWVYFLVRRPRFSTLDTKHAAPHHLKFFLQRNSTAHESCPFFRSRSWFVLVRFSKSSAYNHKLTWSFCRSVVAGRRGSILRWFLPWSSKRVTVVVKQIMRS